MQQKFKKFAYFGAAIIIIAAIVGVTLFFTLRTSDDEPSNFTGGAIVTNGIECAKIGRNIVESGGSFADVAVATVICEGITCPQSSGLGGGFLATMYIKKSGQVISLNAREVAPKLANSTMYVNTPQDSYRGGRAVAVPGELRGLWELHQRYGKLPWKRLFEDSIKLAREGHIVSPYLVNVFADSEADLLLEPTLKEIYIDPSTNKAYKLGDKIKRPKLAETLEIISNEGIDVIYGGGRLGKSMVEEIRQRGGIITEEDLLDYQARWRTPVSGVMKDNSTLYTMPLPSNGAILIFIMNLLRDYELKHDALSYHRIVEAFKYAYARRTFMGDEPSDEIRHLMTNLTRVTYADEIKIDDEKTSTDFEYYGAKYSNPEDQGTAHISILMPNGDAIAITATINWKLGAFFRSQSTGFIMNNEMDDFSTPGKVNIYGIPASPANFIQPGKNPLSSMCPTILVDKNGDPRLVIGGAGGSRIPTGVAFSMIKHLFMNESISSSINTRRLHHQLAPMNLLFETDFDANIVNELKNFGHNLVENKPDGGFAAVVGISKIGDKIEGSTDVRRGGGIEVF